MAQKNRARQRTAANQNARAAHRVGRGTCICQANSPALRAASASRPPRRRCSASTAHRGCANRATAWESISASTRRCSSRILSFRLPKGRSSRSASGRILAAGIATSIRGSPKRSSGSATSPRGRCSRPLGSSSIPNCRTCGFTARGRCTSLTPGEPAGRARNMGGISRGSFPRCSRSIVTRQAPRRFATSKPTCEFSIAPTAIPSGSIQPADQRRGRVL
jgi:hypothetical protein